MPARLRANPRKREVAREKLTVMATTSIEADNAATQKRHRMYAGMLKAFNSGLTYDEIAEITSLSVIRVSQVLASQREKA